ncbi:glycoside hydrolase family 73 protein [Brevibacillus agri]|uniref:glycoside hydrolase family 73 protein n=1 Tax=Brevibacillus agri TaxID=51101 RepID=UPI002E249DA4|nr:glycoside hydrolase family 73 protein [Brevibacillus agri]MED1654406.1 glycoside hydrolase family 73 protein [Brevibacillus agri]MED1688089.1 glycoside hydrolase family 73 protein [Brevibacillus agri]MED1691181.1 glycoside hydrolase family 73 protein [Brevibacillus agri]MED1699417.1 glycoside hydrolase family 73 protein [Brevibacillus agri]
MTQQEFIAKIAPEAVADMRKTRVPASLTIAQAILESNWGRSGLTQRANNLFGIKGTGPAGSVSMPTTEYVSGKAVKVNAAFRKYNSWAESIADHSALILKGTRDKPTRYHGVLGADYKTACIEIWKGGYATDPAYPQKLIGLIEQYGLAKYDMAKMAKPEKPVDKLEDWEREEGLKAIDSLAAKGLLNNPEDWKKRLTDDPARVLSELPWLMFTLFDRATDKVSRP